MEEQLNHGRASSKQLTKHKSELILRLSPHILLFVVFCFWFSLYTYPSIFTPYLDDLGSSLSFSGVVVGSYGFTQMLLRLPAGVLSDKLQNKKVFVSAGLFFSFISALGFILTSQLWLILMLRALAGVAAAMWVQMSTLYISYYHAENSWKATGRINFTNAFGTMLATLSGGLLADRFGWTSAFILAASVAAIGLFGSFFVKETLEEDSEPEELYNDTTKPMKTSFSLLDAFLVGKDKLLLWSSIFALMAQLVTFATAQGFVPIYAKQLGAGTDQIALMATLAAVLRAVASLIGGSLAGGKRISAKQLIIFGFILNGSMILLLPFIPNMPLLIVNQMLCGLGGGLQMTLLMGLCTRNIASDKRSSAMGFYQAVYGIGMVLGPVIVGTLSDTFSLELGFTIIGIISLMTSILAINRLRRYV